jgi:hypothetical protein
MQIIWLVLSLLAIDLAALLFAVDTRSGLEHTPRWPTPRRHASRRSALHWRDRHAG